MLLPKILLGLAVASNLTAMAIYLRAVFRNRIRPHAFTFLVWSIILGVNFAAQIYAGVGTSSILLGTNLLACLIIFSACLKKGYTAHDNKDIISLALGLAAIALWLATKHPLYSVILSCIIDLFAFIPSFRKSYRKPGEDSALAYYVSALEYLLSFPSYQVFSLTALLYPIWVLLIDASYATLIVARNRQLKIS